MSDIVDAKTRSKMMSGIRGQDTKPEMILRRTLHARGFRYRLHSRHLPGRPDLVLTQYRAAIFVHGCFWHRHERCKYASIPATRPDFWLEKFRRNVERDKRNIRLLEDAGWRVKVVWECELRKNSGLGTLDGVIDWLRDG